MTHRPTSAELLTRTHRESGLTWDQLARYFGVSRRAVHLWAAGGRMSATNEELLAHLVFAVDRLYEGCTEDTHIFLPYRDGVFVVPIDAVEFSSWVYFGLINYINWCARRLHIENASVTFASDAEEHSELSAALTEIDQTLAKMYEKSMENSDS